MSPQNLFAHARTWLVAASLLANAAIPAHASSIFVREEFGFSFFPGQAWTLEDGGPSVTYDGGVGQPTFDLRYADDTFYLTALVDNTVGVDSLPFGLDVYPSGVDPVTPDFDCAFGEPCYNGLGFIAMLAFPAVAGQFVTLAIPPVAGVDEPATWLVLALGLGFLALRFTRKNQESATARLVNIR